jgi:hypothetical protein
MSSRRARGRVIPAGTMCVYSSNFIRIDVYSREAVVKGIPGSPPQVKVGHLGRAETLSGLQNDFISWYTSSTGVS